MTEDPPINPIIYAFIGIWILLVIIGFVMSWRRAKAEHVQYTMLVMEVYRVTQTLQSEGFATRHLLERQEQRRRQTRAREAKLQLNLGGEAADAMIAVQRILDAEEREESES
jgi:uncharacterized membrane protein